MAIDKSKEVMKLALEALEHMLEDAKQERLTVEYWNECVDAITALREALAEQPAPVQQEPVAVVSGYYGGQCVILPIDHARIFNSNTPLYTKECEKCSHKND